MGGEQNTRSFVAREEGVALSLGFDNHTSETRTKQNEIHPVVVFLLLLLKVLGISLVFV